MKVFEYKLEGPSDDIVLRADKISQDGKVTVIVRDMAKNPFIVTAYFRYTDIGFEVRSPLLNWKNVILCSNFYGIPPQKGYMEHVVQRGRKTSATHISDPTARHMIENTPEGCSVVLYNEYSNDLFLHRNGCLRDYFDFESVKQAYLDRGVNFDKFHNLFDWDRVSERFDEPLSNFANEETCGINLQNGGIGDDIIITGLVLGYPVESTIAYITENFKQKPIYNNYPPDELEPWQDAALYLTDPI